MKKPCKSGLYVLFLTILTLRIATLCEKTGITTLPLSRINNLALEVYKALNGLCPSYMTDLFTPIQGRTCSFRNAKDRLNIPDNRTLGFGNHSIQFQGAKVWNNLPNNITCVETLKSSKKNYIRYGRVAIAP